MKKLICRKKVLIILSLLFMLTSSLIWCAGVEREGAALSAKLIRLHIVADSDTNSAQRLKLLVRDRVLDRLTPALEGCASAADAAAVISRNLKSIESAAEEALREEGCCLPVSAVLKKEVFDKREYDSFTLPAGEYTALRLVIGGGNGHNWWCVVFPPLCLSSAIEDDEDVLAVLNEDEVELITEEGYVVKFKVLEILTWLKEKFIKAKSS
jgi:stage II sporulation protein R